MALVVDICLCPQFEAVCLARMQGDVGNGFLLKLSLYMLTEDTAPYGYRALRRGSLLERPQNLTVPRAAFDIEQDS
jgi:hypothetical protein